MIRINLDLPDGTSFNKVAEWKPEEFAASRDRCDVHIGDNSFSGDLHSYKTTARIEDLAVDINVAGKVPAWRPGTGHLYFGPQGEHEFNWLPGTRRFTRSPSRTAPSHGTISITCVSRPLARWRANRSRTWVRLWHVSGVSSSPPQRTLSSSTAPYAVRLPDSSATRS
jgi:hypothetical protein